MAWLSEAFRGGGILSATATAAGCISRGEQGCQRVRVRSGKVVAGATARLMINTLIACHVHRYPNSFFRVAIEQEQLSSISIDMDIYAMVNYAG